MDSKTILLNGLKDAGIELPPVTIHTEKADWKSEKEQELSEQIHSLLSSPSKERKWFY